MRKLLFALALLCTITAHGQQLFTAPTPFWQGVPTGAPSSQGARVRFDVVAGRWYSWTGSVWTALPWGIATLAGNSAPAYTPGVAQSPFVLVLGTGNLYQYVGPNTTDWVCRNCSTDAQALTWNGSNGELSISGGNTVDLDGRYLTAEVDGSTTNELQTLGLTGRSLSISSGNSVTLPNDLQTLSFSSPNLSLSPSGGTVDLSGLLAGVTVSTDATLTGDGSGGSPLGLAFPVLAPDGSDTAPSYSFANYSGTGMYRGADGLDLVSQQRITLSAGGNNSTGYGLAFYGGNTKNGTGGGIAQVSGSSTNGAAGNFEQTGGTGKTNGGGFLQFGGGSSNGTGGGFVQAGGFGVNGGPVNSYAGRSVGAGIKGGGARLAGGESETGEGGDATVEGGVSLSGQQAGRVLLGGSGLVYTSLTLSERDALTTVSPGQTFFCTDGTATDGSTGVLQTYNGTTWKNHW